MLISWTARMSSAYDGYRYGLAGRAARTSGPDVQEQKSAPWRSALTSGLPVWPGQTASPYRAVDNNRIWLLYYALRLLLPTE